MSKKCVSVRNVSPETKSQISATFVLMPRISRVASKHGSEGDGTVLLGCEVSSEKELG